jgi:hypothetical protein
MSDMFWQEIQRAVKQVSHHRERQIELNDGAGTKATIVAAGDAILISLEEVPADTTTLVVP